MKTNAERQLDYRAKLKQAGLERLHCWIKTDARVALRDIAERHGKTVGDVIELGMLLARQHLDAPAPAPATRRPTVIITNPAAEPRSVPALASPPLGNTDSSPEPAEPPGGPPQAPNEADALIRAAAADAWCVEP